MDLIKVKRTLKLTNPGRPLFYNTFGKSPLWAPLESGEPLASRKGVAGNCKSEGSGTANSGPDEQEPYKRLNELDESRSGGMTSETPKGACSLSRYGRHWRKEGILTRGDPTPQAWEVSQSHSTSSRHSGRRKG